MFILLGDSQDPNLLNPSEDITNSGQYGETGLNISPNFTISPLGLRTADLCAPNLSNSFLQVTNTSVDIDSNYTFSVFLLSTGPDRNISISIRTTGLSPIGGNELITVTNSWKRFLVTRNVASNSVVRMLIGGGSTWETGENLSIWGCQLNKGSLAPYQTTGPKEVGLFLSVEDDLNNLADSLSKSLDAA